ncbi:MAG: glycogen debranching enzyme family protein [Chloroflexi bacterium]|nr:glycogen debranching enzyme family protein [Chloroflexota bacterium]
MVIEFGRDVCGDLANTERREWLVTNGIGGFASGTIAGLLTRRYHGLLFVPMQPPVGRMLLVSKLEETAVYDNHDYPLYIDRWTGGVLKPTGYQYLEEFCLRGTTPVWNFAFADALLEKRIWMQQGANTTYVQYRLRRGIKPLKLSARVLVNYRNSHNNSHADNWNMKIDPIKKGLKVTAYDGAVPYYLLSDRATTTPQHDWYRRFFLMREANRGLDAIEDNLHAGDFEITLQAGESVTFVFSTETTPKLDGTAAYTKREEYEASLLNKASHICSDPAYQPYMNQLVLAADQFVVKRPLPTRPNGRSILAGYHWFSDWSRDTMVALPGLLLTTGRHEDAATILRTYAYFIDQGMLPNRFPDGAEKPEYHAVDATFWYFEAIRAYYAATQDMHLVRELYPALQDIIAWHQRGTRYNIGVDHADGLLFAGEQGHRLTWMNAEAANWVVTPRIGKPVEVNALWYNALCIMAEFAAILGYESLNYEDLAAKAKTGFARFWDAENQRCFDIIDVPKPDGSKSNDARLRPNQLLAASLPYSPLTPEQQKEIVDGCGRHLLTSHGLRTLTRSDPAYIGSYGGDEQQRAAAYHQGTVWSWLMGPFVQAHLRVYNDPEQARSFLTPLLHHLSDYGVGSISDVFDGDPPFTPRGCIAKAWSVGELLRVCQATFQYGRLDKSSEIYPI